MKQNLVVKLFYDTGENQVVMVDKLPFTIGRSLKNSLVVDRNNVSARHMMIDEIDGDIYVSDCGSTNGLYHEGQRIIRLKVDRNLTVFMAAIKLDVIFQDDHLDKTLEIELPPAFFAENKKRLIIRTCISVLFFLIPELCKIFFTDPINKDNYGGFLLELGGMALTSVGMAGGLSLFSKIHCKKYQFFNFLWTTNAWMGLISLYSFVPYYAYFYLGLYRSKHFFDMVIPIALLWFLVSHICRPLFTQVTRKRIMFLVSILIALGGMFKVIFNFYDDRWGNSDYQGIVAYPLANYSESAHPLKSLIEEVDRSINVVDRYRLEKKQRMEEEKKEERAEL